MLNQAVAERSSNTQILPPAKSRFELLAPYLLALFFGLWALRGIGSNNVVDTDAARHAMNGAFIHDLLRSGQILHPIEYGKYYYGRLPALSMPFHPPLFPAIEAFFYGVFGVNLLAARLAVALATALCVILLYRLILATHRSHLLASVSIVTFFFWKYCQIVSSDVMLEFPALAFALGALYCLRDLDKGYSLRRGLLFALLAGAAVWTKQQTVFLGVVPFLCVLLARRWRLLTGKTLWISSALFGIQVVALLLLSLSFHGTGADQATAVPQEMAWIFLNNFHFYMRALVRHLGLLPLLWIGFAIVASILAPRKVEWRSGLDLYLSWVFSYFPVLLLIGPYAERYLFFVYPALIVIGYAALWSACRQVLPPARAAYVPIAVAAVCLVFGITAPVTFLSGPAQAADVVMKNGPGRVLYCGDADGNFIFGVRSLDPDLREVVITGQKLPNDIFSPDRFEAFARGYGVNTVVLERGPRKQAWDRLDASPSPSMVFEQEIPVTSSFSRWKGSLRVYRFSNPAQDPRDTLRVPLPKLGEDLTVRF